MPRKHSKLLTPGLVEKFCALICEGVTQECASWSCGVNDATVWKWRARGQTEEKGIYRDFWEAYRKAEGDCEVLALSVINRAARDGDWRAMAWRLERMRPERYGQKIGITYEERQKLATDLLSRIRQGIDETTYERVAQILMENCDEDAGAESTEH